MKTRYRLIRRGNRSGAFYCVDTKTGKRASLSTSKEDEAIQVVQARNQAERQPVSQHAKRRQQVLGLGYSLGKSRQRAPVLSTQGRP